MLVNSVRVETEVLRLCVVDELGIGKALMVGEDHIGLYLLFQAFKVGKSASLLQRLCLF